MNNKDDLSKNYIESQKRQKEIIEESKKRRLERRLENKNQNENIGLDSKDSSSSTDHENKDYLKDYLKNFIIKNNRDKELFQEIERRLNCLDLASKCEKEVEKIDFIDTNLYGGFSGDAEDDTWDQMKYSFLDKYELAENDYDFVFSEIEYICLDKGRFCKYYNEILTEFKKIIPNLEEFKKDFKLFLFSYYFDDEPQSIYRGETEFLKDTW